MLVDNFSPTLCLSFVLVVLVCFLILSSYFERWKLLFKYKNLPPGPFCWPIIGYAPIFSLQNNYIKLMEATKKFGDIFGIFIGNRYAIVVEDYDVMKTFLDKEEFLSRIPEMFHSSPRSYPSIFNSDGEEWRDQKKFWQRTLRLHGISCEAFRSNLRELIVDDLVCLKEATDEDMHLESVFQHTINNISFLLSYGKRMERGHKLVRMLSAFEDATIIYLIFNFGKYFFSWLGYVPLLVPQYRKSLVVLQEMEELIREEIREHQQNLNGNDIKGLIDLFLIEMQESKKSFYNMPTLIGNTVHQLLNLCDPLRQALMWFLLFMAAHPEIQKEIQSKIDTVVGEDRAPELKDKTAIPLLDASIMETIRLRTISHLYPSRRATKDTKVCGYDIPKGTLVIQNVSGHFRNPKYWRNPDEFDPLRFLSADGTSLRVPEYFIPLSFGKRGCLGESMTSVTLFLITSSILQRFRVVPPKDGINLDIYATIRNLPVYPFVRFQTRN